MRGGHPMERASYDAFVGRIASASFRIVSAMEFDYLAFLILYHVCASYVVSMFETHFASRQRAKIFLRRVFAKIVAPDVDHTPTRKLAAPLVLVLGFVNSLTLLDFVLRVFADDRLGGVHHRHYALGAFV